MIRQIFLSVTFKVVQLNFLALAKVLSNQLSHCEIPAFLSQLRKARAYLLKEMLHGCIPEGLKGI